MGSVRCRIKPMFVPILPPVPGAAPGSPLCLYAVGRRLLLNSGHIAEIRPWVTLQNYCKFFFGNMTQPYGNVTRPICNNCSDPRSIWKFYVSPWMQCIATLLLSSRIGLTVQWMRYHAIHIDLTNSARFMFSRSVETYLTYSDKVPASMQGQN